MSFEQILEELPNLSEEERLRLALRLVELGVSSKVLVSIASTISDDDLELIHYIRQLSWDSQIENDYSKGKLDALMEEAVRAYHEGRIAKLP